MTDRGCSTADCTGMPSRSVKLADLPGEGPWPYCAECAASLVPAVGEDCGAFDPITDEMVERVARAAVEWAHEADPMELDMALRCGDRKLVRHLLTVALGTSGVRDA